MAKEAAAKNGSLERKEPDTEKERRVVAPPERDHPKVIQRKVVPHGRTKLFFYPLWATDVNLTVDFRIIFFSSSSFVFLSPCSFTLRRLTLVERGCRLALNRTTFRKGGFRLRKRGFKLRLAEIRPNSPATRRCTGIRRLSFPLASGGQVSRGRRGVRKTKTMVDGGSTGSPPFMFLHDA